MKEFKIHMHFIFKKGHIRNAWEVSPRDEQWPRSGGRGKVFKYIVFLQSLIFSKLSPMRM